MMMVGTEIAKMHLADIIHGDLTTSNMMFRHPSTTLDSPQNTQQLVSDMLRCCEPVDMRCQVLVDFGLAYTSSLTEDKAVDLYVLERAFASTHPDSEPLFGRILEGYKGKMGKAWTVIGRRLEEGKLVACPHGQSSTFNVQT
jgi:tRNA A-37 threonylcarbamoyl transferase component Bud32